MDPLKLGFIGGGFVGQIAHISNYSGNPKSKLHAIAEARPLLRNKLIEHYGFEKGYSGHQELIQDEEIQAVVAITRRQHTGAVALDVLRSGKHLITEKPMCHTLDQAKLLVSEAKKNNAIYSVGYMRRFDEGVIYAKKMLQEVFSSGELGELLFVRAHCYGGNSYQGAKPEVFNEEEVYPAELEEWPIAPEGFPEEKIENYARYLNIYCHTVNLLRHLAGETPKVHSAIIKEGTTSIVSLEFKNYLGSLETGEMSQEGWDESIEFYFSKGKVTVELPPAFINNIAARVTIGKQVGVSREGVIEKGDYPQAKLWAFKRQADSFVEGVVSGNDNYSNTEDALNDLGLIEDIWRNFLG